MVATAELINAEAQSLRQEISTHLTLLNAIVALELTALGTGLTIIGRSPYMLAALAAITSFLWLLWIDRSLSVVKIAAYIAIELAPELTELASRPMLGWEAFLRRIDADGEESERALHPGSSPEGRHLVRSGFRTDWYLPRIFGASPPALLALYASTSHDETAPVWIGCFLAGLLWLYTLSRFTDFLHNTKIIDNAISEAGTRLRATRT